MMPPVSLVPVVFFMMPLPAATLMIAAVVPLLVPLPAAALMVAAVVSLATAAFMLGAAVVFFVVLFVMVPVVMAALPMPTDFFTTTPLSRHVRGHSFFIKSLCRPLDNNECTLRAAAYASAQAIAQVIGENLCLAVDNLYGTFRTVQNTLAASCAQIFINLHDITNHFHDNLYPY